MASTTENRITYLKRVITVEPIITIYFLATMATGQTFEWLEIEKACRSNLQFNKTVCEAVLNRNPNFTLEFNKTQELILKMRTWQEPLETAFPLILVSFLGSFSDKYKLRKPFLLLSFLGELLAVFGCALSVVFMEEWPVEVLGVAQRVVPALFGGVPMIFTVAFAYIADITTTESRTFRMGIAFTFTHVSSLLGALSNVIVFHTVGYYGVLSIFGCLSLLVVFYVIFWLEEPTQSHIVWSKSFITDAFNPKCVVEAARLLLKKNNTNNVAFVFMGFFILIIYNLVLQGELATFILYTSTSTFSVFISMTPIVLQSIATKVVSPDNFAKVQILFSIRSVVESLTTTVANPFYQMIYASTFETEPTAFFYFGGILYALCFPMFFDKYKLRKPFLLLPFLGELLAVFGCVLSVVFMEEWPVEVLGVAQRVVPALFGGVPMFFTVAFAYIADITTTESRTFRMGVAFTFTYISLFLGVLSDLNVFDTVGYYGVLSIVGCLFLLVVFYVIFWLEEPTPSDIVWSRSFIADAFNPKCVVEAAKLLLKKNTTNNVAFAFMGFFILFICNVVLAGEFKTFILYSRTSTFSVFISMTPIVLQSIATKVVSPDNFAKVQILFCIQSVVENLTTMVANAFYQMIYTSTFETEPAAFFYFGGILYALCFPMFL
ncbi:MFS 1 domain containing protein [Asbolus verrucosus]|uniref:MFS 1 domain containing protein n=1 Tax=Asbolus verrucosus TaxID=1661398 RepID=A0A482VR00_ASBVE|nr:MFS 1 domain containing protein [Asbolus verrucosus]